MILCEKYKSMIKENESIYKKRLELSNITRIRHEEILNSKYLTTDEKSDCIKNNGSHYTINANYLEIMINHNLKFFLK